MALWIPDKPLVLASQSAVRRQVLEQAGIPVEVRPSKVDERAEEKNAEVSGGDEAARLLARAKARAVSKQMPGRLVLGADQTLLLGERRFNKPADRRAARDQLHALSGKKHRLYSAVSVVRDGNSLFDFGEAVHLTMRELSSDFIEAYLDAAGEAATTSVGGYQLEGVGAQLFNRVEGDYFTTLGLPLLPLLDFMRRSGLIAS